MEVTYNGRSYKLGTGKYLSAGKSKLFRYRRLHQQKWLDAFGDIPKGYHIHHKDGNRLNNELSNLECIDGRKHMARHASERLRTNPEYKAKFIQRGQAAAAKWHGSKAGIEWHVKHAAEFNFGHFTFGESRCQNCDEPFTLRTRTAKVCSNKCKSAMRRREGIDNEQRNCVICQQAFTINKYSKKRTCSRSCGGYQSHRVRREALGAKEGL